MLWQSICIVRNRKSSRVWVLLHYLLSLCKCTHCSHLFTSTIIITQFEQHWTTKERLICVNYNVDLICESVCYWPKTYTVQLSGNCTIIPNYIYQILYIAFISGLRSFDWSNKNKPQPQTIEKSIRVCCNPVKIEKRLKSLQVTIQYGKW